MKKIYGIILVLAALMLVGCSEQQKAKSLAKKYLAKNSNDGKIEIVECGELEDYEYIEDFYKNLVMMEAEGYVNNAEAEMDIYDIWKDTDMKEAKPHLDLAEMYIAKADSLKKIADETKIDTIKIKRMVVKARGNNALGNKVVQDFVLYFDNDLKHCDKSDNDIAHDLIK